MLSSIARQITTNKAHMTDDQIEAFPFQVALYFDGETLQVRSTENVDVDTMHDMLSAALEALMQNEMGTQVSMEIH